MGKGGGLACVQPPLPSKRKLGKGVFDLLLTILFKPHVAFFEEKMI